MYEQLKRNYMNNLTSKPILKQAVKKGFITQQQYEEIIESKDKKQKDK